MQAAQFLMVGGFVMLAWVLARRKIRAGKKVHRETKRANHEIKLMREHKEPSIPLSGAPPETQRWQAAMFDLQRELKAELDTRIIVVQTLLNQVDEKIDQYAADSSNSDCANSDDEGNEQTSTAPPNRSHSRPADQHLSEDLR